MTLRKAGKGLGIGFVGIDTGKPDANNRPVSTKYGARPGNRLVKGRDDGAAVHVEVMPRVRKLEGTAAPFQQPDAELLLQELDMLRDRGLGDVVLFRSPRETLAFHNLDEITNLLDRHPDGTA